MTLALGAILALSENGAQAVSTSRTNSVGVQQGSAAEAVIAFDHPISLADAASASAGISGAIGYHFQSRWNEGEYFPTPDLPPSAFAGAFKAYYGTDVQVTGLVVHENSGSLLGFNSKSTGYGEAMRKAAEAPEFTASAPRHSLLPKTRPSKLTEPVNEAPESTRLGVSSVDANTWAPNYTETYAMDLSILGYPDINAIGTYSEWSPASAYAVRSPQNMPTDWGMEIDIYLRNWSLQGTRPNCESGYRDRFWAKKSDAPNDSQVISWSVSRSDGEAISSGSTNGSAEPYFDWEDASDACAIQSFAIGIGNPAGIGLSQARDYAMPYYGVNTSIWASQGSIGQSELGGDYQAVSNDCNDLGVLAASSCMGLNIGRAFPIAAGNQSQTILNPSTRVAPRCYGTSAFPTPNAWEISCY